MSPLGGTGPGGPQISPASLSTRCSSSSLRWNFAKYGRSPAAAHNVGMFREEFASGAVAGPRQGIPCERREAVSGPAIGSCATRHAGTMRVSGRISFPDRCPR